MFAKHVLLVVGISTFFLLVGCGKTNMASSDGDNSPDQSITLDPMEDGFEDGKFEPNWKTNANEGLAVVEEEGVVKISGNVKNFPERYVRAGFELAKPLPAKSFEAQIDVLAKSGTFEGAKHRQRHFGFFASGSNKNQVGVQYWANQYRISYDNGKGGKRVYAPSNGDEMTKWHTWRIVYDASKQSASVFVGDRQIGETVTVDLGDSVTIKVPLSCSPNTHIEGNFDNFSIHFSELVQREPDILR